MRLARKLSSESPKKAVGILVLMGSLLVLVGCQGFSSGKSNTQQQQQLQSGTLALGASSVDFGSVTAGTSKTLTLTATNSGGQSLTITSAGLSSKYFSLTSPSLPTAIAAGQSASLTLTFTPNAPGAFTGTVTFTSDASDGSLTVNLTGTGVAAGQLTFTPTNQSFGNVTVGSTQSQSVTLTNNGTSSVNVSQAAVSGAGYTMSGLTVPLTLSAAQSTTFTIVFAPQAAGVADGTVTITSDASNPTLTMGLSGTGLAPGTLGANPTSLAFGSVTVGSKGTLSETIANTGGSSVTISQVAISSGFSLSGISVPLTLAAGQSASFSVSFAPQSAGAASGSITVSSTASNGTLTIPVSGSGTTAVGQLGVSPTTLGIGNVVVGTSGSASGSLTASGASVTISAASTNNSAFSVSGLSLPVTIPAGQSVAFTVTFSPAVKGAATGSLTFTSNAQTSTTVESLTGTGIAAPTHTVSLSWNASSSSNITGYNVYRAAYGTSCGAYSKINPSLNTTTTYTDSSVTDGASYCYATTAVDSSDQESSYSNIVSNVLIPAP